MYCDLFELLRCHLSQMWPNRAGVKRGGRSMCACVRFPDWGRFQDFRNQMFWHLSGPPKPPSVYHIPIIKICFEESCVFGSSGAQPMLLAAYPTPHDLQTSALSDQNSVSFYLHLQSGWWRFEFKFIAVSKKREKTLLFGRPSHPQNEQR